MTEVYGVRDLRGLADSVFSAQVFDFEPGIRLFQDGENLRFAESTRFHENLLGEVCQKALLFACPYLGEAYTYVN